MYLNRHVSGARNTLSDHDFVDQNLHHFPCQMLYFDVFFNQFSAVVANGNFDLDLGNSLFTFEHLSFKTFFCEVKSFDSSMKSASQIKPFTLSR